MNKFLWQIFHIYEINGNFATKFKGYTHENY